MSTEPTKEQPKAPSSDMSTTAITAAVTAILMMVLSPLLVPRFCDADKLPGIVGAIATLFIGLVGYLLHRNQNANHDEVHARINDLSASTARLADREGKASLTAGALQGVIDKSDARLTSLKDELATNTNVTKDVHTELKENTRLTAAIEAKTKTLAVDTAKELMVKPPVVEQPKDAGGKKSAKKGA